MWPSLDALDEARRHGSGQGVKIAILDTGIDQSLSAFAETRFAEPLAIAVEDTRLTASPCPPEDVFGHGTGVAGIIQSLSPEAELRSIRVLDCRKRQHRHEVIKRGAQEAIEWGADILNCSFGVPAAAFSLPLYKSWIDRAFLLDRHVVAASSNADSEPPEWPAFFPQVLAVTAASVAADELRFRPANLVSFAAAGIDIPVFTPGDGSACLTGSSFAAAHLTGLLARLLSSFPGLSPSFAHDALRRLAPPA